MPETTVDPADIHQPTIGCEVTPSRPGVGESMPSLGICPYKGLQPYTESDQCFFFGRSRDLDIIIANLYASPLTVFYGTSGVGKSSVLQAGVLPQLREMPDVSVVLFRRWQSPEFAAQLKEAVLDAISPRLQPPFWADPTLPLDEMLARYSEVLDEPFFIIFDQFEEYFLYHPLHAPTSIWDAELSRAVNRTDITANFLLSMRDDGLSKLDRFQGRIPHLLSNMLRLDHLDASQATEAIEKPIAVYNSLLPADAPPIEVQEELIAALLPQVQTGQVTYEQMGQGQILSGDAGPVAEGIETSFLQMALTRLWSEDIAADGHVLRLETLTRLGGAAAIVRVHLDQVMNALTDRERDLAADVFRYLVTASGTKIAYDLKSLVGFVNEAGLVQDASEQELLDLLRAFNQQEQHIIRIVDVPHHSPRYEIYHDVLAPAILDWRTRYMRQKAEALAEQQKHKELTEQQALAKKQQQEALAEHQARAARRYRRLAFVLAVALALAMVSLAYGKMQQSDAQQNAQKAQHNAREAKQSAEQAEKSQKEAEASQSVAEKNMKEAQQRAELAIRLWNETKSGQVVDPDSGGSGPHSIPILVSTNDKNLSGSGLDKLGRQYANKQTQAAIKEGEALGVDVFHGDGIIDWQQTGVSIRFAFIKATEGADFQDKFFPKNWAGVKTAGLVRGAYHYFRPASDPVKQARNYLQTVGSLEAADLPPVLDVEEEAGVPDPTAFAAALKTWLDYVEKETGRVPIIHTQLTYWTQHLPKSVSKDFERYPLWIAGIGLDQPKVPAPWANWTFWQYTVSGQVKGIANSVDMNRVNKDNAEQNELVSLVQNVRSESKTVPPVGRKQ